MSILICFIMDLQCLVSMAEIDTTLPPWKVFIYGWQSSRHVTDYRPQIYGRPIHYCHDTGSLESPALNASVMILSTFLSIRPVIDLLDRLSFRFCAVIYSNSAVENSLTFLKSVLYTPGHTYSSPYDPFSSAALVCMPCSNHYSRMKCIVV